MTKRDERIAEIKERFNRMKTACMISGFFDASEAFLLFDEIISEMEKEIERSAKTTVLIDFLTKTDDGSKVIGFSRNGALKSLNKAMHLARLAVDDKVRIEQMKKSVAEYDQEPEK